MSDNDSTPPELATAKFEPLDIKFEWGNEEWAMSHLVSVRIATVVVNKTQEELEDTVKGLVDGGLAPELLENMAFTKNHLKALVDLVGNALTRQFLCLERLGYSPDFPPPDGTVH